MADEMIKMLARKRARQQEMSDTADGIAQKNEANFENTGAKKRYFDLDESPGDVSPETKPNRILELGDVSLEPHATAEIGDVRLKKLAASRVRQMPADRKR